MCNKNKMLKDPPQGIPSSPFTTKILTCNCLRCLSEWSNKHGQIRETNRHFFLPLPCIKPANGTSQYKRPFWLHREDFRQLR